MKTDWQKWIQTGIVVIGMAAAALVFVVKSEANQAAFLKEADAYKNFATKQDLKDALESVNRSLEQLNKNLERHMAGDTR